MNNSGLNDGGIFMTSEEWWLDPGQKRGMLAIGLARKADLHKHTKHTGQRFAELVLVESDIKQAIWRMSRPELKDGMWEALGIQEYGSVSHAEGELRKVQKILAQLRKQL